MRPLLALAVLAMLAACDDIGSSSKDAEKAAQEEARQMQLAVSPPMRWEHKPGSESWTRATLAALDREGVAMLSRVPRDIDAYCPNYPELDKVERKAFWAGFMSALAKHESTYNPAAVGGGGRWFGLLQIAPGTWRGYGCEGNIKNGADNMACAVRIMSKQVARDNAVARGASGSWRGVARDWGPMRSSKKRADIAAWTSTRSYCRPEA